MKGCLIKVQTFFESMFGKKSAGWMANAADDSCHLDCLLVPACLPGGIVTTITTTARLVRYCYNKYVCWSEASASDIHAFRHKFTE